MRDSSRLVVPAYASLIATVFFSLAVISLLFLAPDVDPLRSGISHYADTEYGWLIAVAIVLVGASGIALSVALRPTIESTAGRMGLMFLIAWGLTSVLAGLFPLDPPGSESTLSGSIHNLAGLNFLLIVPAVLLIELARPAGSDEGRSRIIAFRLAWLLLAASALLFTFNGPLDSLGLGGAIQRLYWLVVVSWLLLKAIQVSRSQKPHDVG